MMMVSVGTNGELVLRPMVTHVTQWGLNLLARRGPDESMGTLSQVDHAAFRAAGLKAGAAACDGHRVREGIDAVGYHLMRIELPTCAACAVLVDAVLEQHAPRG